MQLPAISLPNIELPFDVAVLLHPAIDHFVIAIPVIVLLIELINTIAKRRALSLVSLLLLLLAVVLTFAAYISGVTDGKEAYDMLTPEGQADLKAHKLLGTYILFMSAFVVIVKLLAMALRSALFRALFIVIMFGYIAVILFQGKEGGELVYEHGANVERVKALDDALFDCKDELTDAQEELKEAEKTEEPAAKPAQETAAPAAVSTPAPEAAATVDTLIESAKAKVNAASKELLSAAKEKVQASTIEKVVSEPETVKIETH
jgi:uncharacterized membrane protein